MSDKINSHVRYPFKWARLIDEELWLRDDIDSRSEWIEEAIAEKLKRDLSDE